MKEIKYFLMKGGERQAINSKPNITPQYVLLSVAKDLTGVNDISYTVETLPTSIIST